jgi:hypothetical protein
MRDDEISAGLDEATTQWPTAHREQQIETEAAAAGEDAAEEVTEFHLNSPPLTPFMERWAQRRRVTWGGPVQPKLLMEEVDDPAEVARFDAQDERARLNGDWLQAHWPELLPRVRGKFLAVAGREAFVAPSPQEALALARAAHPTDDGVIVEYVRPEPGPRIYAYPR